MSSHFGVLKETCVSGVQGIPVSVGDNFPRQDLGCCLHDGTQYYRRPVRLDWRWVDLFYIIRVDGEEIKLAPEQPVLTTDGPVQAFRLREDMLVSTPGNRKPAIVEWVGRQSFAAPCFWFTFETQELLAVKTICLLQPGSY